MICLQTDLSILLPIHVLEHINPIIESSLYFEYFLLLILAIKSHFILDEKFKQEMLKQIKVCNKVDLTLVYTVNQAMFLASQNIMIF